MLPYAVLHLCGIQPAKLGEVLLKCIAMKWLNLCSETLL